MSLRSEIIRIAADLPRGDRTRREILSAVRFAREVRGPGGLLFNFDRGEFHVRTFPTDPPYNQTYTAAYFEERPKRQYAEMLNVVDEFKGQIMRMSDLYDVMGFIEKKVKERTGKPIRWHFYHMPD